MREQWKRVWRDYYRVLGLDPEAEAEAIDGAFRALARKYHPDRAGGPDAERMKLLIEASEVLRDPQRRHSYDSEYRRRCAQKAGRRHEDERPRAESKDRRREEEGGPGAAGPGRRAEAEDATAGGGRTGNPPGAETATPSPPPIPDPKPCGRSTVAYIVLATLAAVAIGGMLIGLGALLSSGREPKPKKIAGSIEPTPKTPVQVVEAPAPLKPSTPEPERHPSRARKFEEDRKQAAELEKKLAGMQADGRQDAIAQLKKVIAQPKAPLDAPRPAQDEATAALQRFRDLKALLDESLKSFRPDSGAVAKIRPEIKAAAHAAYGPVKTMIESKDASYQALTRELLPTAPKAMALQKEIDGLKASAGDMIPWVAGVCTEWPFSPAEAKRRQEETANALGVPVQLEVDLGNGVKMAFVLIPAGQFVMGSTEADIKAVLAKYPEAKEWVPYEVPAHKVTLTRPFYIGKCEITQEQWEAAMNTNPSKFKGPKNPVETVSWDECRRFLARLSQKHPGKTFRLPTEAEWEYACRAGSQGRCGCRDDWGKLGEHPWFSDNSEKTSHPVGQRTPNAWGLCDMHGNVWEWCQDLFGAYNEADATDPTGPLKGVGRAVRGGSWLNNPGKLGSATRLMGGPGRRVSDLGLRVVFDAGSR